VASIIARKRAQASDRQSAHRDPKRHMASPQPCALLSRRRPAENKVSPSPILLGNGDRLNPWEDLVWTQGKALGGDPDMRMWKARLYPLDRDPFVHSLHWAYAVHLTHHRDPAKFGWYAIVKGRDPLNLTKFEYGPCESADRAKYVIAEWLEDRRVNLSLADGDDELGRLTQGAFLTIISGAPSGAASVARGL
jgi:hypothetical protein